MSAVGFEPVHPLPARFLAESRAHLGQARVDRREPQRPAGAALVSGVLDVVVRRVDLAGAGQRVVAAGVGAAKAARVHLPRVETGPAVDDPLGYEPSHATGA